MSDLHQPASAAEILNVTLKFPDVSTFADRFASFLERDRILLPGVAARPLGTPVRFQLKLKDNTALIGGEGHVEGVVAQGQIAGCPPGMVLRFAPDEASRPLCERILSRRAEVRSPLLPAPVDVAPLEPTPVAPPVAAPVVAVAPAPTEAVAVQALSPVATPPVPSSLPERPSEELRRGETHAAADAAHGAARDEERRSPGPVVASAQPSPSTAPVGSLPEAPVSAPPPAATPAPARPAPFASLGARPGAPATAGLPRPSIGLPSLSRAKAPLGTAGAEPPPTEPPKAPPIESVTRAPAPGTPSPAGEVPSVLSPAGSTAAASAATGAPLSPSAAAAVGNVDPPEADSPSPPAGAHAPTPPSSFAPASPLPASRTTPALGKLALPGRLGALPPLGKSPLGARPLGLARPAMGPTEKSPDAARTSPAAAVPSEASTSPRAQPATETEAPPPEGSESGAPPNASPPGSWSASQPTTALGLGGARVPLAALGRLGSGLPPLPGKLPGQRGPTLGGLGALGKKPEPSPSPPVTVAESPPVPLVDPAAPPPSSESPASSMSHARSAAFDDDDPPTMVQRRADLAVDAPVFGLEDAEEELPTSARLSPLFADAPPAESAAPSRSEQDELPTRQVPAFKQVAESLFASSRAEAAPTRDQGRDEGLFGGSGGASTAQAVEEPSLFAAALYSETENKDAEPDVEPADPWAAPPVPKPPSVEIERPAPPTVSRAPIPLPPARDAIEHATSAARYSTPSLEAHSAREPVASMPPLAATPIAAPTLAVRHLDAPAPGGPNALRVALWSAVVLVIAAALGVILGTTIP